MTKTRLLGASAVPSRMTMAAAGGLVSRRGTGTAPWWRALGQIGFDWLRRCSCARPRRTTGNYQSGSPMQQRGTGMTETGIALIDRLDAEKRCSRCGEMKRLTEFSRRAKSRDGLMDRCKPCSREVTRRWAAENRERHRERSRRWKAENPEQSREHVRRWHEQYRERMQPAKEAAAQVYNALRRGDLVRGTVCESCSRETFCEAAHEDYTKPLTVRWLCRSCHRQEDSVSAKTLEGRDG